MEEELRFHLAMKEAEHRRRGMSPAEASRAARLQFGNINVIKDAWRDVTGGGILEVFGHDFRFACRTLSRDRVFAFIAVIALALGIGANTALFTVVNQVLLRPLPFPAPEELVAVTLIEDGVAGRSLGFSFPDYRDLRREAQGFDGVGAFAPTTFVVAGGNGEAAYADGARVTPEIIPLLGIAPLFGRTFSADEDQPGNRSVLIGYELWQRRFHGALSVIGAPLTIDGFEYKVIGVMPRNFQFPIANDPVEVWTTFAREHEPMPGGHDTYSAHRDAHFIQVIGRLRAGADRTAVRDGLDGILRGMAEKYPETNHRLTSSTLTPLLGWITRRVRAALILLVGAALCVLGIACANVANLLLGRASTRQKEIAVRAALGAGRGRIARQLLVESFLLAVLGGSLGLCFAGVGTHYIVALLPPDFPRSGNIAPDFPMLTFTAITTLATTFLFGFAPAWHVARCQFGPVLNDCSRLPGGTPRSRQVRALLVVMELVLAFVLLGGALTLIRGFREIQSTPLGFNPEHLVATKVSVPGDGSNDPARSITFYREMLARLTQIGGIQSAAAVWPLPFKLEARVDFEVAGRPIAKADLPRAEPYVITTDYFRTMEIPLKAGRNFDERDSREAPQTVIVNETLARQTFPNESALGKRILPGLSDGIRPPQEREIIGVVGDVASRDPSRPPMPAVYLPHSQCAAGDLTILIREDGFLGSLDWMTATVKDLAGQMDPSAPVGESVPVDRYLAESLARARLSSIIMAIFAVTAVILTGIGVYGVMAYSVAQRTHEIGIRLAFGAQKRAIFGLIVGHGLKLILYALPCGAVLTLITTRFLRTVAPAPDSGGLITTAFVAVFLTIIGIIACWFPAHKAASVDPLRAIGQR